MYGYGVLRLWVMRVSSCLTVRLYPHPYDLIPQNLKTLQNLITLQNLTNLKTAKP